VDDQIRVERELRRRSTSKAVIGGTRTIDIAYEITVENHRPNQARVSVHDHIPVSTDGDIKVRLRETSPNPAEQNDLGELTWELSLDGGQAATIRHRFTIEHPAQVTIAGSKLPAAVLSLTSTSAVCRCSTGQRQNGQPQAGVIGTALPTVVSGSLNRR
jgi:uncharacterized protein DUF4139